MKEKIKMVYPLEQINHLVQNTRTGGMNLGVSSRISGALTNYSTPNESNSTIYRCEVNYSCHNYRNEKRVERMKYKHKFENSIKFFTKYDTMISWLHEIINHKWIEFIHGDHDVIICGEKIIFYTIYDNCLYFLNQMSEELDSFKEIDDLELSISFKYRDRYGEYYHENDFSRVPFIMKNIKITTIDTKSVLKEVIVTN